MTIDPPLPASIIAGMTARSVRQVPVRLTSMTVFHCSSESSHSRPQLSTPALATRTSRRPNCSTASATRARTAASSRMSTTRESALRPSASISRTVSARSSGVDATYGMVSEAGAQISQTTTSAPSAASRTA